VGATVVPRDDMRQVIDLKGISYSAVDADSKSSKQVLEGLPGSCAAPAALQTVTGGVSPTVKFDNV
jgi:hypothetical protein